MSIEQVSRNIKKDISDIALNLGDLLKIVGKNPRLPIFFGKHKIADVFSYRGYYEDVALGYCEKYKPSVQDHNNIIYRLINLAKGNRELRGYKGGNFTYNNYSNF